VLTLILACIACYAIGSVPVGYLLVKKKYRKDLTSEGSKNVGTLNTLTVSKSKTAAAIVLLADFLKGGLPVYCLIYIFNLSINVVFVSSIFLIIGHNYPVWLGFKGGRGLATGAGIFSVVNVLLLFTWCALWLIYFFLVKKDVLAANLTATLLLPFLTLVLRSVYIQSINPPLSVNEYYIFVIYSFVICFLILSRHTEVLNRFKLVKQKNIN
jgi:acyl phosphate:glycerol-3-phosphate acyltransferase